MLDRNKIWDENSLEILISTSSSILRKIGPLVRNVGALALLMATYVLRISLLVDWIIELRLIISKWMETQHLGFLLLIFWPPTEYHWD